MTKPRKFSPRTAERAKALAVTYEAFFDYQRRWRETGDLSHARGALHWARMLLDHQRETGVWLLTPDALEGRISSLEYQTQQAAA